MSNHTFLTAMLPIATKPAMRASAKPRQLGILTSSHSRVDLG